MMLLLLQTALAWTYSNQPFDYITETNCAGFAPVPAGSSWTYRMWAPSADPMDDFIDDIVSGAEVWDAGPGTINRGADWAWVRGSDHNNTLSPTDSQSEVLYLTHAELQAHLGGIPVPSFAAITMRAMLAPHYVCAGINPDQTESEAEGWFWDNTIRSEGKWSIDCP